MECGCPEALAEKDMMHIPRFRHPFADKVLSLGPAKKLSGVSFPHKAPANGEPQMPPGLLETVTPWLCRLHPFVVCVENIPFASSSGHRTISIGSTAGRSAIALSQSILLSGTLVGYATGDHQVWPALLSSSAVFRMTTDGSRSRPELYPMSHGPVYSRSPSSAKRSRRR